MNSSRRSDVNDLPLAARFITAPQLSSPDEAVRTFSNWFSDIAPEIAAAFDDVLTRHPLVRDILLGIAESSPYLFDLIRINPDRAIRILQSDPETHFAALIERTRKTLDEASAEADVMTSLRQLKAEGALMIAMCDIGGVWEVMRVTRALTDIAVFAVQGALRFLLRQEVERGRLMPPDPANPEVGSGITFLAMGKMGAGELNYSSDIDLIAFFDNESHSVSPDVEPQTFFVRVTQGVSRILQQRTGDGYVFRVDLRLRPDPASTQVAISIASALNYYEREGRTWERAAMIKANPCAGDERTGEIILAELSPFVWRKHLDFAALADVHNMKRQMQTFRGQSEISVEGHNVKVGRGGIREIEFFAQTQQLIAGGRHPDLRIKPTLDALSILAEQSWITFEARDELSAAYVFLRRVEHRLQMIADEQTHELPDSIEAVERFSRFMGYDSRESFARDLLAHLNCVQGHYSRLFEGDAVDISQEPAIDYSGGPANAKLMDHLAKLGFENRAMVAETIQRWIDGEYRVLRVETTRQALIDFIPTLLKGLADAEQPDNAVISFDRLLQALQRGGRLISLLSQNGDLVSLVSLVLGAAPRLGDMLARQPQLMDGLIDPRFFGAIPDQRELSLRLAATLDDANSYEEFLDRLRLFGQESLFLLGTRILSGTITAQQAGIAFADVAEGIGKTLHRLVGDQFALQHGRVRGQETGILAMGKLGSREMTASSDLDLIFVYDFDHDEPDSDGERPLHGAQYFARLTQRLISSFTTRTNYGVLYEVDMRLRPSGRAGPVASRIDSFAEYQEVEAWTWEHMALTRARVISASPEFRERIETVIRNILTRERDAEVIASDVVEMRRAIALEKGEQDIWDLKYAAGGMVDIEFIAQYLQLVHASRLPDILNVSTQRVLDNAVRLGVLPQSAADILRPAARLYHDLTQILRLCVSDKFNPDTAGDDLLRVLTRAGNAPDFSALAANVRETQRDVRRVFEEILNQAV